jgi:hypothetical protein
MNEEEDMWIFTNKGFFSIDQDKIDPASLIVRSRFPRHISQLFPDAKVQETPGKDYRYRATMPRAEVVKTMVNEMNKLDYYPNFKESIEDGRYQDACVDVWATLHHHQKRGN